MHKEFETLILLNSAWGEAVLWWGRSTRRCHGPGWQEIPAFISFGGGTTYSSPKDTCLAMNWCSPLRQSLSFPFLTQINNCLSCFLCILQPFEDNGSNHVHNPAAGEQSSWVGVPPALLQHPAAVWSLSTGTSSLQLLLLLEKRESSPGWDKLGGLPLYLPTRNIKAADDFS